MKIIVSHWHFVVLFLFSLLAIEVHAEGRENEKISTQAIDVELEILPFVDEGCHGKNQTWDFSQIDKDHSPQLRHMALFLRGDGILCDQSGKLITFFRLNDTIQISQIETPSSLICYQSAISVISFPLSFGEQFSVPFEGTGDYEGKLEIKESGLSHVSVDGTGTLILAEGDTLRNTMRVHRQLSSDIQITDAQSHDTVLNIHKSHSTYEWFSPSTELPVFAINEEITTHGERILQESRYAYRIPTFMNSDSKEGADNDCATTQNVIGNLSFQNYGNTVEVTYSVSQDSRVRIILSDSSGIVYYHTAYSEIMGNECIHEVPLQGLRHGQYIIYVNTDNETNALTISVK